MSPATLIKVARPGFWPTHLWFFLLPLGQREMFGRPGFWLGCAYVCFPLGLLLYGWNDLFDAETDRRNQRKGWSRRSISPMRARVSRNS